MVSELPEISGQDLLVVMYMMFYLLFVALHTRKGPDWVLQQWLFYLGMVINVLAMVMILLMITRGLYEGRRDMLTASVDSTTILWVVVGVMGFPLGKFNVIVGIDILRLDQSALIEHQGRVTTKRKMKRTSNHACNGPEESD